MLQTLIITLIAVTLVFAGIGIRILLLKDGQFKGTCASQSPYLKNQLGECTVCGKSPEEECKMPSDKDVKEAMA